MKYMVLMQGPKGDWQEFNAMPPKDIKAHIAFMEQLNAELAASGELVDAQGLAFPDQAKIVTCAAHWSAGGDRRPVSRVEGVPGRLLDRGRRERGARRRDRRAGRRPRRARRRAPELPVQVRR